MFRVMQEALQNVAAHARASATWVRLTFAAQHVSLEVGDDGQGFDPQQSALPADGHSGLPGMRERALNLSGALSIDSRPQYGTRAGAHFLLQKAQAKGGVGAV